MKTNQKILIGLGILAVIGIILAWAPWMDDKALHNKILKENGWKDGTIISMERAQELNKMGNLKLDEEIFEESGKLGITDGVVICDYKVAWVPFGRYVASCEGGYFVPFYYNSHKISDKSQGQITKEQSCINSGGTVWTGHCCGAIDVIDDFPSICPVGNFYPCACSSLPPKGNVKMCDCGEDRCFNGTTCVHLGEITEG
ncbi:exported hypothetical protein [groundwater metagenome]|uniref:Uncharacterized protein n=1 Tax=groundwater metagenome TaxID=717931 RepID=A0A098E782_9ZZZZ